MKPRSNTPDSQGVALPVALLLLLMITLMAVAGLRDTALQEHMSGNLYSRGLAFHAAESALRVAEVAVKEHPQNYKSSKCIDTDPTDPALWQSTQNSLWSWVAQRKPLYRIENMGRGPGWGNEAECDGGSDSNQYGSRCGELPEACYYRITGISPRNQQEDQEEPASPDDGRADVRLQILVRRRLEQ
jgi:hypothetical protein